MLVEAFFPLILPEVLGCPDPMLAQQVAMVANHFCTETGVWDEIQEPVTTPAGQTDYEIDAPTSDSYVVRVADVWLNNFPLQAEQIRAPRILEVKPTGYHAAKERGLITLNGKPQQGDVLVVRAIYAPKLTSKNLPDLLMQRYAYAIASGAKARLMAVPGQAWSNPTISVFYRTEYDNAVIDARIDMERDNVPGSLRVKPRLFY